MPNGESEKYYWLKEAIRKLTLALIPSRKRRQLIEESLEDLSKHEDELHRKDNN